MRRAKKTIVDRSRLVQVLSHGALAGPIADGRLIPVLILDASERTDMRELFRQHQHMGPGDARYQWAISLEDEDQVMLLLSFDRPSEVDLALSFSIADEGIVVDSMIRSGTVYLQLGTEDSRVSTALDDPRVLVELPDTGFGPHWDSLFEKRMTRVIAKQMGVPVRTAKPRAKQLIAELRKVTSVRMGA